MWSSLFGRSALLVMFAFCLAGLQNANAQIVAAYAAADTTCTVNTLAKCNGSVTDKSTQFTDDGTNDGNYADLHMRRDTVTFMPEDKWSRVQVVFTKFDLEDTTTAGTGDTLLVYQGDKAAVRGGLAPAAKATGTGVSLAFGGWVDAECDPAVNPSGALTFIFKTDGDNAKGAGWDAWVDCAARDIKLTKPNIANTKLTCADNPYATVTIPAVDITAATGCTISDSVKAVVTDQHGMECFSIKLDKTAATSFPASFSRVYGLGSYKVEYTLCSDPTKKVSTTFSVQAPALVCNDNVTVPLGSACMITLTPDDILEQPCDVNTGVLDYDITITLGTGKDTVVLRTTNVGAANVAYPIITKEDIAKAKMKPCDATATVKIERTYYRGGIPGAIECNNGIKKSSCETVVSFFDQSIPWVSVAADADTIVACDAKSIADLVKASAIDNCDDEIAVTHEITMEETDPCFAANGKPDTTTATVLFTAVDDCGNVGTLAKVFTVIRPNEKVAAHIAKTKNVQAECDEDTAASGVPGLKTGTIKNGVFTVKDTVKLSTNEYICGYILTKESVDIPATDCGKKTFVTWSILDWCDPAGGPSAIDTTFIEFTDTKAPTFTGEASAQVIAAADLELGHFECTYDITKNPKHITKNPKPMAEDNCDDNVEVILHRVFRIENGVNWRIEDEADWAKLDCDSFRLMYIARDDCHEQPLEDTTRQIVVIKDVTKPSAVAVDQLNISLPNEWGARVSVEDIDAGSYDACGIKSKHIRIKGIHAGDAGWADHVDIGCQYVHPDLQIELRIIDEKGNENIAWSDIFVEDKIKPYCVAPEDMTEDCDKFHNGELGASTDADGDRKMSNSEWTDVAKSKLREDTEQLIGQVTLLIGLSKALALNTKQVGHSPYQMTGKEVVETTLLDQHLQLTTEHVIY